MQELFIQNGHTQDYPWRIKSEAMKNNIRTIRQRLGMTLEDVAEKADTTFAQVHKLENGERRLTQEWMYRIAGALQCAPEDLIKSPEQLKDSANAAYRGYPAHAVDEDLITAAMGSIVTVAKAKKIKLSEIERMVYAVQLYNHVMKYRGKGEKIEPSESIAELILHNVK